MTDRGTRHPKKPPMGKKAASPSPDSMDRLLRRCGIHLTDEQRNQLWRYHQLLRHHDDRLNLTRIRNFDNMVLKLYADSILPAMQTTLPSPLLDLGTGPGMPGVPLKIFRPDLHIILAESRQNRCDFLKMVVDELGIDGLEVLDRGIAPDFDRKVQGVITRAVEPMADTLERVAGCLSPGGLAIFMKGPGCDKELEEAVRRCTTTHSLAEDIPYQIPGTPHRRRLVIFRRNNSPMLETGDMDSVTPYRIRTIESEGNPLFKDLRKLLGGKGVKKQEKALVCGSRLVAEMVGKHPQVCLAWVTKGDGHPPPDGAPESMEWIQLTPDLFARLDVFGTKSPILLAKAPKPVPWHPTDDPLPGCTLLVPFQDPENVGAVIRSAEAFQVDRIVLLAESANPFHPKAVRASAAAVFSARLFQGPGLAEIPRDLKVIALATKGRPLSHIRFPQSFCLLAGLEGPGLPQHWEAQAVSIPMNPAVESLNAAVATAIALYQWRTNVKCLSRNDKSIAAWADIGVARKILSSE